MYPKTPNNIIRSRYDTPFFGASANDDWLTTKSGLIAFLDRRIEGIHVNMKDHRVVAIFTTAFRGDA